MAGIEKLLTRIRALFEPRPPSSPEPKVDVTPERAIPETAASVERTPEATPMATAEETPLPTVEEGPAPREIPAVEAEAPSAAPIVIEEPAAQTAPPAPAPRAGVLALRLENERGPRSIFEVTKSGATIGRGSESTIQLADLSVSRKHARIAYRQDAFWLSDLGSMGGTWVDGSKLAAPRRVATGQTIDIGVCRLSVLSAGDEEEPLSARTTPQAASRR